MEIPFAWVRLRHERAYVSGHGPLRPDGAPAGPFGRVPTQVPSKEPNTQPASPPWPCWPASRPCSATSTDHRLVTLSGHVNTEPGYPHTTAVVNPASELIVELYGPEAGRHARTAIGAATLPLNLPVVLAAEVEVAAA